MHINYREQMLMAQVKTIMTNSLAHQIRHRLTVRAEPCVDSAVADRFAGSARTAAIRGHEMVARNEINQDIGKIRQHRHPECQRGLAHIRFHLGPVERRVLIRGHERHHALSRRWPFLMEQPYPTLESFRTYRHFSAFRTPQ